jgi:HEAT repeat protein/beta-lactamase regulating signal transducer with metallopeptidase domain
MNPATLASMDAFFSFAALAIIKATLLLGVAAALSLLLRRHSAALRHLVWSLAIAGVVVLPFAMATSPVTLHLLPVVQTATNDDGAAVRGVVPGQHTAADDHAPVEQPGINTSLTSGAVLQPDAAAVTQPTFDVGALVALWLFGALALLVRFAAGMFRLRGIVRRAAPIDVAEWTGAPETDGLRPALRMSDEVDMPFAAGLFRPTIVLPASSSDWSSQRRAAVLQHELAHLSRGDLLMNAISHFARALYWFNPLAWYAAHRVRIESERACDDAVLRRGARASDYAEHLLSIAGSGAGGVPTAALAMARPSAFEGRLLAILEPDLERSALSRLKVAAATIAFLAVVMPLAAASPTAKVEAMTPNRETILTQDPMPDSQPAPRAAETARAAGPATSVVPALTEALADANGAVRMAAVKSLGELQDPRAIAALGKVLREDADPRVRRAAAEALGQIDDSRAVPHLVAALRSEQIANVREAIVESLGEIDDPSAVTAVAAVVRDSSVGVRRAAASALNDFEEPSALPALLSMVRDTDAEVRRHVADALSDLQSPQTFDALVAFTRDSDAEVRAAAVNGLGNLEDARTLTALLAALRDANAEVRSQAADAIHNIPDLDKAPPQLIALLSDPDADVRHNVAHALGGFEDEAAVPALKRALADTNADVRRAVAEALSEIGGAEAITALMALLKDQDPEIRRIAAEALGKGRE